MKGNKLSEKLKELKPKHFLVLFVSFIVFFGAILGIYNYRQEQIRPAEIRITSPAQGGERIQAEKITVAGETKGNRKVVVSGIETRSGGDGRFSVDVPLVVGENKITIEVADGREHGTATIIVFREEAPLPPVVPVNEEVPAQASLSQTGPELIFFSQVALVLGSFLVYLMMRNRLFNPKK